MTYPATKGTDFIRRLGLSDLYRLTSGAVTTVSVDKRGGLYQGQVFYTEDATPTVSGTWIAVSADDTADVSGTAVPTTATAVAFYCTAITDTVSPLQGALFTVADANTTGNLTRHNRRQANSGAHTFPAGVQSWPNPPGDPLLWYDFNDISTLWTDTAGTTQVAATDDAIARIDSKGSNTTPLLQGTLANRPLYKTNYGGSGFAANGEVRYLEETFSGLGSIATPYSMIMVWAEDGVAAGSGCPGTLHSTSQIRFLTSGNGGSTTIFAGGSSSSTSYAGQVVGTAGGYGVVSHDPTAGNCRSRMPTLDGDSTSTFGSDTAIPDPFDFILGASDTIGSLPFEGYLIEALLYGTGVAINHDVGPVEYDDVKQYMLDKYGFVNP